MYAYTYTDVGKRYVVLVLATIQDVIKRHRALKETFENPSLISYLTLDMLHNLEYVAEMTPHLDIENLDYNIPKDQPQVEED